MGLIDKICGKKRAEVSDSVDGSGIPKQRLSYEDSCRRLQKDYIEPGTIPPRPDHMPRHDDPEPLGVSFFKTFVGDGDDLGKLTLPHTFFGRSEINNASFQNTDFTESNLCWNDFIAVNFADAILARSDIRASTFHKINFTITDLREADMRRSSFKDCIFDGAMMKGTKLTHAQGKNLRLSERQRDEIDWTDDDGPEPGGG